MATVRLQRRIHRPPRRRLPGRCRNGVREVRASPSGPRARHSPPGLRHWGAGRPGPAASPGPPARAGAGKHAAYGAPAWHRARAAPPKFPHEGLRDKSRPETRLNLKGGRAPQGPRCRHWARGPARAHASPLFSRPAGAAYVQHRGSERFSGRRGWGGRCLGPPPRSRVRGSTVAGAHPYQSYAVSLREGKKKKNPPGSPPRTRGELATFALLFKLAGRHHRRITLSIAGPGRPTAGSRTSRRGARGRSPRGTWSVTEGTKSRAPSGVPSRAAGPHPTPLPAPGSAGHLRSADSGRATPRRPHLRHR